MSNDEKHGLLFIVSAPAGTGKTTLVKRLQAEFHDLMVSISHTTRKPRFSEIEGKDYYFIDQSEFINRIAQDEFFEYVQLYGEYYGTSKTWVQQQLQIGKNVLLTIDTQGALQVKKKITSPALYIFIKPPSYEVLQERLEGRKTETAEKILERLEWAKKEMGSADVYDYLITNQNLEEAYDVLRSIFIAEQHKLRPKNIN